MTDHMVLTEATAEAAVLGGAVLGGGGGGSMTDGLEMARLAVRMGDIRFVPLDAIADQETLLTVSAVGAPAARERYVRPAHYLRAVELFRQPEWKHHAPIPPPYSLSRRQPLPGNALSPDCRQQPLVGKHNFYRHANQPR